MNTRKAVISASIAVVGLFMLWRFFQLPCDTSGIGVGDQQVDMSLPPALANLVCMTASFDHLILSTLGALLLTTGAWYAIKFVME